MSRVDLIAEEFRSKSHRGQYRALYGMNRAAADLFRAHVNARGIEAGFLILCREDGLILYFRTRQGEDEGLPGFSAPMSYLQGTSQELEAINCANFPENL